MALLDDVKVYLRISSSNTSFNTEISDLIDVCKSDLILAGILEAKIDETDPLIKRAITTYCKWQFGFDNPDSEKFKLCYESLKNHLKLATEYIVSEE